MKKFLVLLLAFTMLAPLALAQELIPGEYKPPVVREGQYPIAQKNAVLKYWMPISASATNFISSYAENPAYRKLQQDTGVTIEFIHPAAGSATTESFQTMLMSGQLPDMIQMTAASWYSGGLKAMYDDGAIIDLAPYLAEYAPQYNEVIHHNETAQRQIIDNGKVYGFYMISYADAMPFHRFNVNKTWLDEFNMKEPCTIEEYERYFQAILDNKPGVIPLFFNPSSVNHMGMVMGAYDMLMDFYLDPDGKTVRHYVNEPAYKEVLKLLNKWYQKGYISKDFATMTGSEGQSMFDNQLIGCIGDSVDSTYTRSLRHRNFEVTNCPYPRLTHDQVIGSSLAAWPVSSSMTYVTVITSACKNVEAAIQFLNYGYTFEGSLVANFGVEGETWNWGEDGIPQYTDLILNNPQGMTYSNVSYVLRNGVGSHYRYTDAIAHPAVAGNAESYRIRTMWNGDQNEQSFLSLPPITLTTEEADRRNEIMVQVNTYCKEMKLRFITGAESLDDFDAYVDEVNRMGMPEAIAITQAAFDRYNAQ